MVNYLANFPFLDPFFLHFSKICQNEMAQFLENGSKTPARRQRRCSGVFIVNFKQISHLS